MPKIDTRFEVVSNNVNLETPWKKEAKFVKYDESMPQILYDELSRQRTPAQVAKKIGISKQTLFRWVEDIEDMREAYEQGMTNFEADVEENIIQKYMIHDDDMVDPPVINNKLVHVYLASNLEKFANLDKKGDTNVTVNNVSSGEGDLSHKLASAMSDILKLKSSGPHEEMKDVTPKPKQINDSHELDSHELDSDVK